MTPSRLLLVSAMSFLTMTGAAAAQGDPEVIARIIDEGKNRNQVWDHLIHLSEQIGPRLTGSTRLQAANEWTRDTFESFGLSNCHLEQWGEVPVGFDRGPSYAKVLEPMSMDLEFTTRSWTAGTNGPVKGVVIKEPRTLEELAAVKEKLPGAWVLARGRNRRDRTGVTPPGTEPVVQEEIAASLKEAGIAGYITPSRNELVVTTGSWRDLDFNNLPTEVSVQVTRSNYDAINSRLADGEEVVVEINLDHTFVEGPIPVYNTIAEIPGTEWPEQVVIVSAHLDSWDGPGNLGTQDNGTGSSVTLEAARLLMEAGAKPKRTIRFILWTGEEQGLFGSEGYVASLSEEERANISAVFVDDGGTNYEGGLVGVADMAPMLTEAVAPVNEAFPDMPVQIHSQERMPRGGGSDHASFNAVGIPGFFWDEAGSGGREGKNYQFIHHTQHDTPRYAVEEYLVQSSTCSAITAYNLACADTLLPRAKTPEPDVAQAPANDPTFEGVSSPLTGEWDAVWGEGRQMALTLEVAKDNRVRGKTVSRRGESTLTGTFNPETGELKFNLLTGGGMEFPFVGVFAGESIKGTIGADTQFSAPFSATRKAATATEAPASTTPPAEGGGRNG